MTESLNKTLEKWIDGRCQDLRECHRLTYSQEQISEFKNYYIDNLNKFDNLYRYSNNENVEQRQVSDIIKYNWISTSKNGNKSEHINNKASYISMTGYTKLLIFQNCYGLDISGFVAKYKPNYTYQQEVILCGEFKITKKTNGTIYLEQVNFSKDNILKLFDEFTEKVKDFFNYGDETKWNWRNKELLQKYKNTMSFSTLTNRLKNIRGN